MTIQALAWALDQSPPGTAKLALLALANHCDHTNGFVHFDATTIAREASIQVASLWRYLGALERNGYLDKDEKGGARSYWLVLDRESSAPWAWSADDKESQDLDSSEPDVPQPSNQGPAPRTFSRARQVEARETASAPSGDRPVGQTAVIEGTDAFRAWSRHYRDVLRKPPPFVHAIKTADGKDARGFYQPSLFPPRQDRIENLEGVA